MLNKTRLNADGSNDDAFYASTDDFVKDIAVQQNGQILIGGYFEKVSNTARTSLARLSSETVNSRGVQFDFDGDGKSDVSIFRPSTGIWYINGSTAGLYGIQFGDTNDKIVPADYDGDGKTDVAVWRGSNGTWYIRQSADGFTGFQFGAPTDITVPADFDGDGKTDFAVFRPSNGIWYIRQSGNSAVSGTQFGAPTDLPIQNAFVR